MEAGRGERERERERGGHGLLNHNLLLIAPRPRRGITRVISREMMITAAEEAQAPSRSRELNY